MKTLIIIPAVNEELTIGSVITDLKAHGYHDILVVDDGSNDQTAAKAKDVKVVKHIINRGLGAGLGTGFQYAKAHGYDLAITFDADRQHQAVDITKLTKLISNGQADVVIGSRMSDFKSHMPFDRLVLNFLANFLTYCLYGVYVSDSQSGLRALNKHALSLITLKTDRMEVSSEILHEVKRNHLRFAEVPIKPIYTSYSRAKGQDNRGNLNAFSVAIKMIMRSFH